jgi:LuxR family transcriptional regulator, regulator of acetate metabolism
VDDGVQVAVADDGAARRGDEGEETCDGSGLGIRLLAEKAARLGGRASLVHDEDGGTTLRVLLPGSPR